MENIIEMIKTIATEKLCEAFELTNSDNDVNIPFVRGLFMTELEKRDPVSFADWMDTDDMDKMDFPSLFFGV